MATRRDVLIDLIRREAKDKNILAWGKLLFPEKFNLPFCSELHGYFVETRHELFLNTEAPRNHAKTAIECFLIAIFQALEEPDTFRHYLNVQETATKAAGINLTIREELETNENLRSVYGNQVNPAKWTERQFVLSNGVIFTAIGAGESIRGLNYKNIRPDYIIVDDLYGEDDINNVESTTKKNRWFWGALYPARAKSRKCCIHVQGTAINKADLMYELKSKERWASKTFQAIKDFDKQIVLWPELNTFESLMADKEDMGSVIFSREMQNERRDDATSIIKESWLSYYEGVIPGDETVIAHRLGCDPSIGEKEQNDFTGLADVHVTRLKGETSLRFYINEVYQEHLSLDGRVKQLESWQNRKHCTDARIEGIAGFKDFVAEVRRRTNLPVTEIDHVKDKITNLENKSKWFENKKVFINKNMSPKMLNLLIEQLTNNYPTHDDIRDAVLLCIDEQRNIGGFDVG
jgi:uncharacterized protein YeeX (DUF496 family)